jgi:hypothetical protein
MTCCVTASHAAAASSTAIEFSGDLPELESMNPNSSNETNPYCMEAERGEKRVEEEWGGKKAG